MPGPRGDDLSGRPLRVHSSVPAMLLVASVLVGCAAARRPALEPAARSAVASAPAPLARVISLCRSNDCALVPGTDAGLTEGRVLTLYRAGAPLGRVRVYKAWPDVCFAQGIDGFRVGCAQKGDEAR